MPRKKKTNKPRNLYFFGAPIWKPDRRPALEDMEKEPLEYRSEQLGAYLNRLNDKTIGVLAIAGIVIAFASFVLDKASKHISKEDLDLAIPNTAHLARLFCVIAIVISTFTISLLCINLRTVWRTTLRQTEADVIHTFHLFARRAIRLQLSLYGIVASTLLCVCAMTCLEGKPIWKRLSPVASLVIAYTHDWTASVHIDRYFGRH